MKLNLNEEIAYFEKQVKSAEETVHYSTGNLKQHILSIYTSKINAAREKALLSHNQRLLAKYQRKLEKLKRKQERPFG